IWQEDPSTGVAISNVLHYTLLDKFKEYAAFADLTFHLTSRFDVRVGGRASHDHEAYNQSSVSSTVVVNNPQTVSSATSVTYLVVARYKLSQDLTVYARLASGYRPGGPNENQGVPGIPSTYQADKTKDYEVGLKAETSDHR